MVAVLHTARRSLGLGLGGLGIALVGAAPFVVTALAV